MNLTNKTILIVGASSGIGREVALLLSKKKNRIVITARRQNLLDELKTNIEANGSECLAIAADSCDEQAVLDLVNKSIESFNGIDVALLNAGGGRPNPLDGISTETLKQTISINLDTVTNYLAPLIQHMKDKDEAIIANTCSPAGFYGLPTTGAYCTGKAATRVLFQAARIDMLKTNVTFTSIYPGFAYTDTFTEEDRVDNGIPKFMVITKERAAKEVLYALENKKDNHFFPKRLKIVHTFGRLVPEALRKHILA